MQASAKIRALGLVLETQKLSKKRFQQWQQMNNTDIKRAADKAQPRGWWKALFWRKPEKEGFKN
jgi:hypothetical protein